MEKKQAFGIILFVVALALLIPSEVFGKVAEVANVKPEPTPEKVVDPPVAEGEK